MRNSRHALLTIVLLCVACVGPRPSGLAAGEGWLVQVKSLRLPEEMPWYTRLAEHSWIEVRRGAETDWWRLEVTGRMSGVVVERLEPEEAREDRRWDRDVAVLARLTGPRAEAAGERLMELALAHPDFGHREEIEGEDGSWTMLFGAPEREPYSAWPGPNSNTFVADLVRATPELGVDLHHNAVGKDLARGFDAGVTTSGTGLYLDTDYLGLAVGLREGAELHLLGLTLGVGLWPPALKLPLLPRLGVHQGWVSGG